jgi:hypothetical protein
LSTSDKIKATLLAFLFIVIEIGLGTALFYFVIYIERHLGGLSLADQGGDRILYWFGYGGKILLLAADSIVILLFVGHGIRSAYQETWGRL